MKLAIIGSGMIVKDFLPIVKDLPDIELKAIVGTERSKETVKMLQSQYGINESYTNYQECLEQADIDTVYIAVPNHLHFIYAKKALECGKHVICEKPFTLKLEELEELEVLSIQKDLVLVEAITNQFLSNYSAIKNTLNTLGKIKIIDCNFSQHSSRYDRFKNGELLPAFNPKMGGGALMDLNIYNIHFVVGLLGMPKNVQYLPNMEQGIDTSGILTLQYPETQVVCIAAKDCTRTLTSKTVIQGENGAMIVKGSNNIVEQFDVLLDDQEPLKINKNIHVHRMYEEFKVFSKVIMDHDMEFVRKHLEHSKMVMNVVEKALASAELRLG